MALASSALAELYQPQRPAAQGEDSAPSGGSDGGTKPAMSSGATAAAAAAQLDESSRHGNGTSAAATAAVLADNSAAMGGGGGGSGSSRSQANERGGSSSGGGGPDGPFPATTASLGLDSSSSRNAAAAAMTSPGYHIKANCSGDIRRFSLRPSEFTFAVLTDMLSGLYRLEKGSFKIRYYDEDSDVITLATTAELLEAYRLAGTRRRERRYSQGGAAGYGSPKRQIGADKLSVTGQAAATAELCLSPSAVLKVFVVPLKKGGSGSGGAVAASALRDSARSSSTQGGGGVGNGGGHGGVGASGEARHRASGAAKSTASTTNRLMNSRVRRHSIGSPLALSSNSRFGKRARVSDAGIHQRSPGMAGFAGDAKSMGAVFVHMQEMRRGATVPFRRMIPALANNTLAHLLDQFDRMSKAGAAGGVVSAANSGGTGAVGAAPRRHLSHQARLISNLDQTVGEAGIEDNSKVHVVRLERVVVGNASPGTGSVRVNINAEEYGFWLVADAPSDALIADVITVVNTHIRSAGIESKPISLLFRGTVIPKAPKDTLLTHRVSSGDRLDVIKGAPRRRPRPVALMDLHAAPTSPTARLDGNELSPTGRLHAKELMNLLQNPRY